MPTPDQLPFQFPEARLSFDDLCKTPANQPAISAIRDVDHWSGPAFCLIGPARSGLSTLAVAWAAERVGHYIDLSEDQPGALPCPQDLAGEAVVVDRADLCRQDDWLLTVYSSVQRLGGRLLLTGRTGPADWGLNSVDLASRLRSAPMARLGPPDEALMRARLHRAAARAALSLPPAVESYLMVRLGLNYDAIEDAVARLAGSAGGRQALTVPMARAVLEAAAGGCAE